MAVTKYVWDPVEDNVIEEYDDAGDTIAEYTTEPDQFGNLISQERSGTTSYFHYDGQGSTLALTDDNGDVTDTYEYNAFGETTASTGSTTNPYRYIGQKGYQYDEETDDYYVRARAYEPAIARWLSVDPIGYNDAYNLYAYVGNKPLISLDPSGTFEIELPIIGTIDITIPCGSIEITPGKHEVEWTNIEGACPVFKGFAVGKKPFMRNELRKGINEKLSKEYSIPLSLPTPCPPPCTECKITDTTTQTFTIPREEDVTIWCKGKDARTCKEKQNAEETLERCDLKLHLKLKFVLTLNIGYCE